MMEEFFCIIIGLDEVIVRIVIIGGIYMQGIYEWFLVGRSLLSRVIIVQVVIVDILCIFGLQFGQLCFVKFVVCIKGDVRFGVLFIRFGCN